MDKAGKIMMEQMASTKVELSGRDTMEFKSFLETILQLTDEIIKEHEEYGEYSWVLNTKPKLMQLSGYIEGALETIKEE